MSKPWEKYRLSALRLARVPELGSRTLGRILELYPDLNTFLADQTLWQRIGMKQSQIQALRASLDQPMTPTINQMDAEGIHLVLPTDDEYPRLFHEMQDSPIMFFLRGAPIRDTIHLSIVGTRKPTQYGRRCAEFFGRELANNGFVIVSGLALGIDGIAERACIEAGGKTVAILAGGIDDATISPASNQTLAADILNSGGTILSEYAPGVPPLRHQFLIRNRLIAGLSRITIVVEASHKSGALKTARDAVEMGRTVMAVPGSIWDDSSKGTNHLLREGATPCITVDDVIRALELRSDVEIKSITKAREILPLATEESKLLDLLCDAMSIDELSRAAELSSARTGALLSILELKGRVLSVGPRMYVKSRI